MLYVIDYTFNFIYYLVAAGIVSYPGVQKGGGNAWYILFAHAFNLLLGNSIMDVSDVDVWAGFC